MLFEDVLDCFVAPKILELCKNAIKEDKQENYPYQKLITMVCVEEYMDRKAQKIKYVPDWFVTADMVENSKDEEWVEEYKQRKNRTAKIEEELLPVAWHPVHVLDWYFDEDEKEALEKLWRV